MEDNKKNVLNNEPKKEEKKKKCAFLVWWGGLSKLAKVGVCAGATVVLASAVIFPTLAATVWKKPAEESATEIILNYVSDESKYYSDQVNLVKDNKYFFKLDLSKFANFETTKFSFFINNPIESNKGGMHTSEYAPNIVMKSTSVTFKKLDINVTPSKNEYSFDNNDCVVIGSGSFSNNDKYLIGSFTSIQTKNNCRFTLHKSVK